MNKFGTPIRFSTAHTLAYQLCLEEVFLNGSACTLHTSAMKASIWQKIPPSTGSHGSEAGFVSSYIALTEAVRYYLLPLQFHVDRVGLAAASVPPKRKGAPDRRMGGGAVASTSSREGTALPQSTAASFPEQEEGAEKLPEGQAGELSAVPTLCPHPSTVNSALLPPDQRHPPTLTLWAGNPKREPKYPTPPGKWGRRGHEPLHPTAPDSEGLNE